MDVIVAAPQIATRVKRLETVDVSRLDPLRFGNPREMAPADKEALRTSVRTLGYAEPIVVREVPGTGRLEVVDGHHRLQVLQEERVARVPVVVVDLNDVEARALVLASGGNVRARWTDELQTFIEGMVADGAAPDFVGTISGMDLAAIADGSFFEQHIVTNGTGVADAPGEFPVADPNKVAASTEHACPSCGYRWSGSADPAGKLSGERSA